ncbi:D-ribose pyranase [Treponema brennaborense]|uniref:D-ribose pyranase n=1 Tax=Treponema brennaborense (strain DSM 12168 / CIP 105900 / DD5/3) TaxID=906968 RepID=F4LMF0_TREBD|nr:D-ribose pyranase [Treponema brennaborense]AEE15712.1 D-ribose pyranase [Treponema brennaborense DSM 12168]
MKRLGILNSDISRVLSYMRHTDTLCIGDCGLPCPQSTELIDIALDKGEPPFINVLKTVAADMRVESLVLAEEIRTENGAVLARIRELFPDTPVEFVPHAEFKKQTAFCKALIRTGEVTPYANVILRSACIF